MRPSKRFIQEKMKRHAAGLSVEVALDAACARIKNYKWFIGVKRYIGVDIDLDRIKVGLDNHKSVEAIHADILDLPNIIPSNSVDLIVSTHTLEHFDEGDQLKVISVFVSLLKPGGVLMFNKHRTGDFKKIKNLVASSFNNVERIPYRNHFSNWYELKREQGGEFLNKNSKSNYYYSLLLKIEKLTSKLGVFNNIDYYFCAGKIGSDKSVPFAINAKQVSSNLYQSENFNNGEEHK